MRRTAIRIAAACLAAPWLPAPGLAAPAGAKPLVVCTEASPDSLNPQLSTNGSSFDVTQQIYDQLVEIGRGGSEIVPGLAESWTVSEDGKAYTFRLRENVRWQSNRLFTPTRPLDADDVVFSFRRQGEDGHPFHKVGGGTYFTYDSKLRQDLAAVERVDARTVRFTLRRPLAAFVSILTHGSLVIQSAEYAAAMQKAGTPELLDSQPLGTGPFQLARFQRDADVRFRPFPEGWGAAAGDPDRTPRTDNLIYVITPDAAVRHAKLKAGECHVARYPNPTDFEAIRADATLALASAPIADFVHVAFKTTKKPFDDPRVRRALADAVDLEALVTAVYQGTGRPAGAIVPPSLWSHDAELRPRRHDPEGARRLLAEAGIGPGLEVTLWAIPVARAYMPNGRRAAELIQGDWARIGVRATIVSYEWGEYIRRARAGEGDAVMFGGTWDFPDPSQILVNYLSCTDGRPGPSNVGAWCDPAFDRAILEADVTTDQARRAALYREAQRAYVRAVPGVLLANASAFVALRREVVGFKVQPFGPTVFAGVAVE